MPKTAYPKPLKITELERLASDRIGGGRYPILHFVTDQGSVVTVTRDFDVAYEHWKSLLGRDAESALESSDYGVVCSREWDEEYGCWRTIDESYSYQHT